jgi:hypothetical protein
MKTQALIVIIALITCLPAAKAQATENYGGALAGYQGGALSDIPVVGPGGVIGHDISLIFGSLGPATHPYQDTGYGYSFITGPTITPPVSLDSYANGASFGAGGEFNAYNNTAEWCKSVCHFSGTWVSAQLSRVVLSNGTYVYTLTGELTGTYQTDNGEQPCGGYVTIPVFDETTLIFQGLTSLSYGGLQVIYQPN